MYELVGNPKDKFSCDAAQIWPLKIDTLYDQVTVHQSNKSSFLTLGDNI